MRLRNITVFCGSSAGTDCIYQKEAFKLGQTLAQKGVGLVYGGAKVGLMGAVADGALQNKGKVIGVIPRFLQSVEIAHERLTELILVETMHQRKAKMDELSDGIIALAGGFGTLEELFEMLTWGQLGLHKKPVGLLNTDGFYDQLLLLADNMVSKGFLKPINRDMLLVDADIERLLDKMHQYEPPLVGKWVAKNRETLKDKL